MAAPPPPRSAPPGPAGADAASLTFIGNATVLLRCCGFTLLTDPNFLHAGQRAHLGYGLTSPRLKDPALEVEDLPDLDVVVLSHAHGDHWDRVARRGLDADLPVVTTRHAARLLSWQGFRNSIGLRTWEVHQLTRGTATLTITALPARHAPGPVQLLLPPMNGSMLEFAQDGHLRLRLYQTGDTLLFEGIHAIPRRYPDIDVGVLHLGGTKLPGGLIVTMTGSQGADLLEVVDPGLAVPVHTDDYAVFSSPLEDFTGEVQRRALRTPVAVVGRGETLALPLRAAP